MLHFENVKSVIYMQNKMVKSAIPRSYIKLYAVNVTECGGSRLLYLQ